MTRIEEIELKPCPFCGGKAVLENLKARKGYEAVVVCNSFCLASMDTITYDTEEEAEQEAIKAWNKRAENEEVKRLTAELEHKDALLKQAIEDIKETDNTLKVMEEATLYVKPGTGIWHTVGIARKRISKYRGLKGE